MNKEIALIDIVDIARWQRIHDHFAQVIGVTIRTVDKAGNLITQPSIQTRTYKEILKASALATARCGRCLPSSFADSTQDEKWRDGYQCYLGLYNFCIPVVAFDNYVIAYMLLGPVFLGQRPAAQAYRQKAEELGISLDSFMDSLIEIKLFTFTGIQSVIELIRDITSYVAEVGYSRLKLERIIPLPRIGRMVHKFYMDKILNALLDVSFNTVNAEVGSVMLLDKETGELYIKVARGLKRDIIKNARLKVGEGIAGLAFKERRFLLLDDTLSDQRVQSRLRRPSLKCAVVAPIKVKEEPLGVMNIASSNPACKITDDKIQTIHRLVELTEATLSDLFK